MIPALINIVCSIIIIGFYIKLSRMITRWYSEMLHEITVLTNQITQLQLDIDVSRVMHGHEPRYFARHTDPKEGS